MNDFELLEKQINSGLEEGESFTSGIIFLLEAKGSEFQSQFITISEQELQCKIAVSCPQKNLMKKKKEEILLYQKGPHLGRRRLLAAARRSPRRELLCAH